MTACDRLAAQAGRRNPARGEKRSFKVRHPDPGELPAAICPDAGGDAAHTVQPIAGARARAGHGNRIQIESTRYPIRIKCASDPGALQSPGAT